VIEVVLFVAAALRISVPYALAAVGATFSERGGVINIALEGIMLNGALGYVLGAWVSHDPWIGLLAAIAAGILTALLHAIVTVRFQADQITSGLGNQPARRRAHPVRAPRGVPLLVELGARGGFRAPADSGARAARHGRVGGPDHRWWCSALVLVVLGQGVLFRTVFGLRLRSIGEHPDAAASLGLHVSRYRIGGVVISGMLAGIAGAWLASEQHSFTDGMTGGRGYIAIAAMIVGKWSPAGAAAACLLFGAAEALQITLQGSAFPSELLQMLPYLVTMLALAGFIGRAIPPRALGTPYDREQT
jgi:simple sugar transport system permease protein